MKQKGFAPIIFLVLIALAVVGYFGYKTYWPKIQGPVFSSFPALDPTASWKTYTNTKAGISFKYPATINLKEYPTSVLFVDSSGTFQTTISWNYDKLTASIEQELTTRDQCPSEVTNGLVKGPIANSLRCDFIGSRYASDIWFNNGDVLYKAEVGAINPNEPIPAESVNLLDQILSTFKFVETSSPTPVGYTCPASGYVDCMPTVGVDKQASCTKTAIDWFKANCPNFKGVAL